MRKELSKINGVRAKFTATISRTGKKNNFRGAPSETVLFTDVRNEKGELVTEHVWFTVGENLKAVFKNIGRSVSFNARVTPYTKGHKGYKMDVIKAKEEDFKLSNPTNVVVQ